MDIKPPLSNGVLAEALYHQGVDILSEEALEDLLPHTTRLSIVDRDQVTEAFAADVLALAKVSGLSAHVVARPRDQAPEQEPPPPAEPPVEPVAAPDPAPEPAKGGRKRADA
jgi:hypothetical protein